MSHRGRFRAVAGSVLFFCVAPGLVVGFGPWLLTGWRAGSPFPYYAPVRVAGAVLLVAAVAFLITAFVRFCEEPGLRARYGEEYDAYRHAVPGWWPRLRPFRS